MGFSISGVWRGSSIRFKAPAGQAENQLERFVYNKN